MSSETRYLLAMSCIIPLIVGGCLYQKMKPQYHWLVYMLLMDTVTETIDFIGLKNPAFKPIADCWCNLYMLIHLTLFLLLAMRNGYIRQRLLQILIAVAVAVAGFCFLKMGPPHENFYYPLLCFVYAVQLFVGTDILSRQVTAVNIRLTHNFWFWASCLFVLQNAYGLLVFVLYFLSLSETPAGKTIGFLNLYVNIFYYIFFAGVLLLVPKRKKHFIHQTS